MESFDTVKLREFVQFFTTHDMQVLANRREAKDLFVIAMNPDGDFPYSGDKSDKLETFLSLNDLQVHGAGAGQTVSTYAAVKIVAEMRRRLRAIRPFTPATSVPGEGAEGSGDFGAARV